MTGEGPTRSAWVIAVAALVLAYAFSVPGFVRLDDLSLGQAALRASVPAVVVTLIVVSGRMNAVSNQKLYRQWELAAYAGLVVVVGVVIWSVFAGVPFMALVALIPAALLIANIVIVRRRRAAPRA